MSDNETDEEIITQYKNGNQEVFKELIDRYASSFYNFSARLANKDDAPDIVQEIFIKIWKNLGKFNSDKASFKTWVFTIARNTTTDFLRKKKNLLFSDIDRGSEEDTNSFEENIQDENLLPEEALQKLEDAQFFNQTLEKLHQNYREVLMLHYQEEMTFEEIGKILNKPLNTVKSQHHRAIIELRKILNQIAP
ncbi:MAG: RNA polymerase sigma factor [Candidatus Paceibacterota bacterium]|jgi:RNA polymerase sigma-70 factor (ECF subfamily)